MLEHPGHRRGLASSARRRSRATSTRPATAARQARAGARRREEPHDRAARRRHRHGRRRGRQRRLRLGRRALHGGLGASSRSATPPTRSSARSRSGCPKVKVGDGHRPGLGDGPARHARAPRQGRLVPRARRRARARRSSPTAARRAPDGDGFFLGVSLLDDVTPEMDAYRDEIFGPVLGVTRVGTYDEARRAREREPVRQRRRRSSRATAASPGSSSSTCRRRHGRRSTCRSRCPVAYYSFGGWKASLFGDRHIYGPGGHRLLHARRRSSPRAGRTRRRRRSTSASRRPVIVGVALFDGAEEPRLGRALGGARRLVAAAGLTTACECSRSRAEAGTITCAKGYGSCRTRCGDRAAARRARLSRRTRHAAGARGRGSARLDPRPRAGGTVRRSQRLHRLARARGGAGCSTASRRRRHWQSLELLPTLGKEIEVRPDDRFVDNGQCDHAPQASRPGSTWRCTWSRACIHRTEPARCGATSSTTPSLLSELD